MPTTAEHQTVHEIDVDASPDVVYGIAADTTRWPQYFVPTVHVQRTVLDVGTERLRIWATGNDTIRTWSSIRATDPQRRFVSFRQEVSAPPVRSMAGTWTVLPTDGGERARLILTHDFEAVDDDPASVEWIRRGTDRNSTLELANIKRIAESWGRRDELEFAFEDGLAVDGTACDVYGFLRDAARWPERLPHVDRLDLTEENDGEMQLMSMWTRAKDGSTHLTESARVCFPQERIVYKQTLTPALIASHTGTWLIEPAATGLYVRSQHMIVLNDDAIGTVPVAGDTPEAVRAFVRESIGANSRATLALAKRFAENG